MAKKQKISPYLWFDQNAEEAVELYTSLFEDSRVLEIARWGEGSPGPTGKVMNITFELAGQRYYALNGGPEFKFTPAVSFFVSCETQEEVDKYWNALLAGGGKPTQCGWLEDRFGLSWQIVPAVLMELLQDKDPARAARTMQAMLKMQKLDIAALKKANAGT
jgi:predicted 3-demethylubiquinone-9 3-methyltransferase (glyoxalase superfamily)